MKLGERIKERRTALGWTQDVLAQKAGLSKGFLSDVENAKRSVSAEHLLDLARVLGLSLDYLMTGEEEQQNAQAIVEIPGPLAQFAAAGAASAGQAHRWLRPRIQPGPPKASRETARP